MPQTSSGSSRWIQWPLPWASKWRACGAMARSSASLKYSSPAGVTTVTGRSSSGTAPRNSSAQAGSASRCAANAAKDLRIGPVRRHHRPDLAGQLADARHHAVDDAGRRAVGRRGEFARQQARTVDDRAGDQTDHAAVREPSPAAGQRDAAPAAIAAGLRSSAPSRPAASDESTPDPPLRRDGAARTGGRSGHRRNGRPR